MSNQRSGNTYRAAANDNSGMSTVLFFKYATKALTDAGYEDPAFYFEQIVDHLRDGNSLPTSQREFEKALGL